MPGFMISDGTKTLLHKSKGGTVPYRSDPEDFKKAKLLIKGLYHGSFSTLGGDSRTNIETANRLLSNTIQSKFSELVETCDLKVTNHLIRALTFEREDKPEEVMVSLKAAHEAYMMKNKLLTLEVDYIGKIRKEGTLLALSIDVAFLIREATDALKDAKIVQKEISRLEAFMSGRGANVKRKFTTLKLGI